MTFDESPIQDLNRVKQYLSFYSPNEPANTANNSNNNTCNNNISNQYINAYNNTNYYPKAEKENLCDSEKNIKSGLSAINSTLVPNRFNNKEEDLKSIKVNFNKNSLLYPKDSSNLNNYNIHNSSNENFENNVNLGNNLNSAYNNHKDKDYNIPIPCKLSNENEDSNSNYGNSTQNAHKPMQSKQKKTPLANLPINKTFQDNKNNNSYNNNFNNITPVNRHKSKNTSILKNNPNNDNLNTNNKYLNSTFNDVNNMNSNNIKYSNLFSEEFSYNIDDVIFDKENIPPLPKQSSKFSILINSNAKSEALSNTNNQNQNLENLEINLELGISHLNINTQQETTTRTIEVPILIELKHLASAVNQLKPNAANQWADNSYSKNFVILFNSLSLNLNYISAVLSQAVHSMHEHDKLYSNVFVCGQWLDKAQVQYLLQLARNPENNIREIFKDVQYLNYKEILDLVNFCIDHSLENNSHIFSVIFVNEFSEEFNFIENLVTFNQFKAIAQKLKEKRILIAKNFSINSINLIKNLDNDINNNNKNSTNTRGNNDVEKDCNNSYYQANSSTYNNNSYSNGLNDQDYNEAKNFITEKNFKFYTFFNDLCNLTMGFAYYVKVDILLFCFFLSYFLLLIFLFLFFKLINF